MAEKFVSCPGDEYAPVFRSVVNDDGTIDLVISDQRNVQSEIQSHAASCDIRNIMQRYVLGDTTVLSRAQGFYADLTSVPTTHAEWLQRTIDAKYIFDSLPADVKSRFGNNFNVFAADAGSEEWFKNLGFTPASDVSKPSDPVPADPGAVKEG